MSGQGLYIYCIADIDIEEVCFGKGGVENPDSDIYTVHYNDISAVVSDAEIKQYRPTRKNNFKHEGNIEMVMNQYNVLPFRFGVVAKNRAEVVTLLTEKYEWYKSLIGKVSNRVELGVKVTYSDMDSIIRGIGESHSQILALKNQNKDISKDQMKIIEVGKIIEKELKSIGSKYKNEIYQEIHDFADESVIDDNSATDMILSASFLIQKEKENEFEQLLYKLNDAYHGMFNFMCVGPFPPYSFVKY